MTDPYRVLGVAPTAQDTEIKEAYKKLVKQYHPDRYQDEDMKRLATEKMADINTAYDTINEQRRNGTGAYGASAGRSAYGYGGQYQRKARQEPRYRGGSNYGYARYANSQQPRYDDININYNGVRSMINAGRINEADSILERVNERTRSAEWYYLKGLVYQRRGWLNDAYLSIAKATRMDGNPEYLAALQQMNRQRSGYMSGRPDPSLDNSSFSDILCTLCLIDACCDINCCGG